MSGCAETLERVRTARLVERYDGAAPRYTSYPTAAQFTPAVGADDWRGWLRQGSEAPASLYLHIPFCHRLCWYCGCNTRAVNREATISSYVDLLLAEAALAAEAAGRPPRIGSIHLGGGTPNMLSPALLRRLMAGLAASFDLSGVGEIAAELDPAVLTPAWVAAAAELGLSRASLGVQDLSPAVQAAVNRPEPFAVIETAVGRLRDAGVASINLDLMYGLPRQGVDEVLATLDEVLPLRPDRIALFGYAHVPWMKPHQALIDSSQLAGADGRFAQSQAAERFLVAHGYQPIGLDHFALPQDSLAEAARAGRLRRNFQGYTTDSAPMLIGLGASSISRAPQGYVQNHALERDWRAAVAAGRLPAARGVAMTAEDRLRGAIIERLMCDFAVDTEALCAAAGLRPDLSDAWRRLEPLERDGLLTRTGGRVRMTERGRPFVRFACAAFDTASRAAPGRHSRVL